MKHTASPTSCWCIKYQPLKTPSVEGAQTHDEDLKWWKNKGLELDREMVRIGYKQGGNFQNDLEETHKNRAAKGGKKDVLLFYPPGCAVALQRCSARKLPWPYVRGEGEGEEEEAVHFAQHFPKDLHYRIHSEKYMLEGSYRTTPAIEERLQPAEHAIDLHQKASETIYQNKQMLTRQWLHEQEYYIVWLCLVDSRMAP